MIWYNNLEKYVGQWLNNKRNGIGMHIWCEPKGELKLLKNRYIGEWKENSRCGFGLFYFSNGEKYEGMWENNMKNGFGVYTFTDGSTYFGMFEDDKMIGKLKDFETNSKFEFGGMQTVNNGVKPSERATGILKKGFTTKKGKADSKFNKTDDTIIEHSSAVIDSKNPKGTAATGLRRFLGKGDPSSNPTKDLNKEDQNLEIIPEDKNTSIYNEIYIENERIYNQEDFNPLDLLSI